VPEPKSKTVPKPKSKAEPELKSEDKPEPKSRTVLEHVQKTVWFSDTKLEPLYGRCHESLCVSWPAIRNDYFEPRIGAQPGLWMLGL
jgi:hypothetical protein